MADQSHSNTQLISVELVDVVCLHSTPPRNTLNYLRLSGRQSQNPIRFLIETPGPVTIEIMTILDRYGPI
jgi:hypothetical protein